MTLRGWSDSTTKQAQAQLGVVNVNVGGNPDWR